LLVEHIDCLLLDQGISNHFGFFYKIGKRTYFFSDDTSLWCWFNIILILYQCHNGCGMIVTLMWDMIVTPVWHNCDNALHCALVWHNHTQVALMSHSCHSHVTFMSYSCHNNVTIMSQ
jgi:hypothetical protein